MGMRPRVPESVMTGLIWFNANNYQSIGNARHQCDDRDGMSKFGWVEYDPRLGGHQLVNDDELGLHMDMELVKSEEGDNWGIKIKGKTTNNDTLTSLVLYAGVEGKRDQMSLKNPKLSPELVSGHNITLHGHSKKLGGDFTLSYKESLLDVHPKVNTLREPGLDPSKTHHVSLAVPRGNIWKAKDIFLVLLKENMANVHNVTELEGIPPVEMLQLQSPGFQNGNMHFIQKTFKGNFELLLTFNIDSSDDNIQEETFDSQFNSVIQKFRQRFRQKFQLQRPFNNANYTYFAREFLSQLLGGIGYFHGHQMVDRHANLDDSDVSLKGEKEGPYDLFCSVPSRSFFPRGFYWDEGFQLMPILNYDSDLTLEILKNWFSLIDRSGWIAREQILGDEARSRVPDQFVVQNPNIANPPTMMMIFSQLLDLANAELKGSVNGGSDYQLDIHSQISGLGDVHLQDPMVLNKYAEDIYPKLQRHYEWFRRTQHAESQEIGHNCTNKQELYRWKGRDEDHCLPSGLDDYPRCDTEATELDVDLMSWMGVMSRSIASIAKLLGMQKDYVRYNDQYESIKENIEAEFWSNENGCYCDITLDEDDEDIHECHLGYISLMPFVHRLIPSNSPHILQILKDIHDPEKLWTSYGVRSLSKNDTYFHKGEDYWRGHIWINMNYLILDALRYYSQQGDLNEETKQLATQIYRELRVNLVENVYREYTSTGYAWEQYNESTGKGQRTKNFLGWTSLVVLIMKMPERID